MAGQQQVAQAASTRRFIASVRLRADSRFTSPIDASCSTFTSIGALLGQGERGGGGPRDKAAIAHKPVLTLPPPGPPGADICTHAQHGHATQTYTPNDAIRASQSPASGGRFLGSCGSFGQAGGRGRHGGASPARSHTRWLAGPGAGRVSTCSLQSVLVSSRNTRVGA